jgi:hypothetical protein
LEKLGDIIHGVLAIGIEHGDMSPLLLVCVLECGQDSGSFSSVDRKINYVEVIRFWELRGKSFCASISASVQNHHHRSPYF